MGDNLIPSLEKPTIIRWNSLALHESTQIEFPTISASCWIKVQNFTVKPSFVKISLISRAISQSQLPDATLCVVMVLPYVLGTTWPPHTSFALHGVKSKLSSILPTIVPYHNTFSMLHSHFCIISLPDKAASIVHQCGWPYFERPSSMGFNGFLHLHRQRRP